MRSSEILSNSDYQFQMFPNQNSPKDFIVSMKILPSASMIESRVAKGHVSFVEHSTTARSSTFTFLRFSPHVGLQTFEAKVPGATDERGWWVRSWGFLLEVTPVVYQWLLLLEPCLGDLHDMHQIHLVII